MVVALDDLPPLLWHAELGRSLPDVWTGERQRGVQLHLLADAVRTWAERYGQRAWTRQLEGEIGREHEDRLMEVIERFDGRSFPTTPGLARQWLTGRYRRRESSLETIYCAELVATTYQHMGLLPKRRPASWYDPGRFWSGDRIDMVPPFALAGEVAVAASRRRARRRSRRRAGPPRPRRGGRPGARSPRPSPTRRRRSASSAARRAPSARRRRAAPP